MYRKMFAIVCYYDVRLVLICILLCTGSILDLYVLSYIYYVLYGKIKYDIQKSLRLCITFFELKKEENFANFL